MRHGGLARAARGGIVTMGLARACVVAMVLGLAAAASASASTISVTTTQDQRNSAAPCSLREAISTANLPGGGSVGGCAAGAAGADEIDLPSGHYVLSIPDAVGDEDQNFSGDLDITDDTTIVGAGARTTVVEGYGGATGGRVFHVLSGASEFSSLTVRGGRVGEGDAGGGILGVGPGPMTVTDARVVHNSVGAGTNTGNGGGIADINSALTVRDSTVSGNDTGANGGGIYGGQELAVTGTTVADNTAGYTGGGIYTGSVFGAKLTGDEIDDNVAGEGGGGAVLASSQPQTVSRSSFIANRAPYGGGLLSDPSSTLDVSRSTLAENEGGGIFHFDGALTVRNSTLSGNHYRDSGGAILAENDGVTVELRNATLTDNVADADADGGGDGGGLALIAGATGSVYSSVVAGNRDDSGLGESVVDDCWAVAGIPAQYSLLGNSNGCPITSGTGNLPAGTDPMLAPLADNGGPTLTHALRGASPLVDAGDPSAHACEPTDQRGVPRPAGSACDIGAYERATCFDRAVNVVGTPGSDTIVGTSAADSILGMGGDDTILGGDGDDRICGNSGNDELLGQGGDDQLAGAGGDDVLDGGAGTDACKPGTGTSTLIGCP